MPDKNLVSFFRGWQWLDDPSSPVTIDLSRVTFIAPWAATLFAAYGAWLREVRSKDVRVWIDDTTLAGNFLERSGFREVVEGTEPPSAPPHSDRILPFSRIRTSADIAPYAQDLARMGRVVHHDTAHWPCRPPLLRGSVHREIPGAPTRASWYPACGRSGPGRA